MENERLSRVWLGHIPDEIWPNILSRLPVKSLLRFRCVSTFWLSLIKNADFHRLHLNNNRDETRLLVVQGPKKNCVLRSSDTFEKKTGTLLTLGPRDDIDSDDDDEYEYDDGWLVECCVDGLVLLSTRPDELLVWNPSIKKCHQVAPLPYIKTNPNAIESVENVEIGLGYDASLKDYKHVRFIFRSDDETLHMLAIYTIGAASWKIIQSPDKGFPDWDMNIKSWTDVSVYLRGSLYFIAIDEEDRHILVSIDLSSEVFCRTSFPDDVYSESENQLRLVDGGRSLAFFESEYRSMWVWGSSGAENESMCWTKRYSFNNLRVPYFLHINKNNDMLIQWWEQKTSFKLAAGKEVEQLWLLVTSYNLQTQDEMVLLQNLQKDGSNLEHKIHAVFGYVENLTLLQ